MNAFNSIKEINRLRKEINRLLSKLKKGISNIYFKVTIETFSKLLGLKSLSPGQFWEAPTHADIIEF